MEHKAERARGARFLASALFIDISYCIWRRVRMTKIGHLPCLRVGFPKLSLIQHQAPEKIILAPRKKITNLHGRIIASRNASSKG